MTKREFLIDMVLDSSAILAILSNEEETESFCELIEQDSVRLISAPTLLETSIVVLNRYGEDGIRELELLIFKANIEVKEFDFIQQKIAFECYSKYGKGRHRANLNYGDCFSYALSKISGEKLLYKGKDFSYTDLV